MTTFLARGLLPVCIALLVSSGQSVRAGQRPPNVVFVLVDDLGWSDLGCYGNEFHETPHIDRLAQEGVRFTDFYAAGAVCSPTRASIQSGQYQARLGITDFIPGHRRPYEKLAVPAVTAQLPLQVVTPAELLGGAGYRSAYLGKWHLGGEAFFPSEQGYDTSLVTAGRHFAPRFRTTPEIEVEDGTYLADLLTDRAIDFLKTHRDEPCFVFLSHYAVHIPLEAKADAVAKYTAKPKPREGINNPVYAAMVEHVDQSVGRIVSALDELELAENTVLIVTSDNGGLRQSAKGGDVVTTNAPLRDEKGSLYEGGIRVPLIVRWPGVAQPGAVCKEPVISVDFWPTLAEIAGASTTGAQLLDGTSLVPLLKDPTTDLDRDALYWHYPHYHHSRPAGAIRADNWKLIEFFDGSPPELYDLEQDISESRSLAAEHPERVQELRARLQRWRGEVGAVMPQPNPQYDPARAEEWGERGGARRRNRD